MDLTTLATTLEEVFKSYPINSRVKMTAEDGTFYLELLERDMPKNNEWKKFEYNVSDYSKEDLKNLLVRYAEYLEFGNDAGNRVH